MTTANMPPITVLHDQRRPQCKCCGEVGHSTIECSDDTEGRKLNRALAEKEADYAMRRHRRVKLSTALIASHQDRER